MDTLAASLSERLGPSATDIVRRDHTAMLAVFHRCRRAASPRVRRGLARSLCSALEVHLQLEEELLYPALREVACNEFLTHATADHDRMRTHIARIRQASPADPVFMAALMDLMREVLHHMAEEETTFLPVADRVLQGRLGELGTEMMRRRMALLAPRLPRLAYERARGVRAGTLAWLAVGALALGLATGHRRGRTAFSEAP